MYLASVYYIACGQSEGVLCTCLYVHVYMHMYMYVCEGLDCHSSGVIYIVFDTGSLTGLKLAVWLGGGSLEPA